MKEVQVLIAGGGPVGMTLACDLARRGITCMLVERNLTTMRHPKMDITNARSMELFRRLALADELRAVAVHQAALFWRIRWACGFCQVQELPPFQSTTLRSKARCYRAVETVAPDQASYLIGGQKWSGRQD